MRYIKYVGIILIIGFISIQFIREPRIKEEIPPEKEIFAVLDASEEIQSLIENACYDCHSYNTDFPWYSQVAPVSWWIQGHINHGSSHLNFSTWGDYTREKALHKLEECFEEVAKEQMPLKSYTWMHADARLTEAQRARLVSWFKKSKIELDIKNDPKP